jgi:hypothetical protein
MSESERRRALNQAVARDANEAVEEMATAWEPAADPLDIRCECSRADCEAILRLTLIEKLGEIGVEVAEATDTRS